MKGDAGFPLFQIQISQMIYYCTAISCICADTVLLCAISCICVVPIDIFFSSKRGVTQASASEKCIRLILLKTKPVTKSPVSQSTKRKLNAHTSLIKKPQPADKQNRSTTCLSYYMTVIQTA